MDVDAHYRFVLAQGFDAHRVCLAGESAGGGITVATLAALRDASEPLPACAWLSCPWVDLEMTGASMDDKAAVDPLIARRYLKELAAQYLAGTPPRTPGASPLYADLRGLPPLLIQTGTAETLLDDSVRLARAAAAADVRITLQAWPDMIIRGTSGTRRSLRRAGRSPRPAPSSRAPRRPKRKY
jgi:acetyl esterase/lipase